eukprot:4721140-Pleurochrysis_carterae.AAC.1
MLLELHDALCVPGLCARLLSTKAMLQKQGIRTHLNDELRFVLPNDNHVSPARTPQATPSRSLQTPLCTR